MKDLVTEMINKLTPIDPISSGVKVGIATITPALALQLRETSIHLDKNRPMNKDSLTKITCDLIDGNWLYTHQGIALDKNGCIVDGFTRISGCIETGCSFETIVTMGVPEDHYGAIDTIQPRNIAQQLHMMGYPDINRAHVLLAIAMINGFKQSKTPHTSSEVAKFYKDHRKVIDFMVSPKGVGRICGMSWSGKAAIARAISSPQYKNRLERFKTFVKLYNLKEDAKLPHERSVKTLANTLIGDINNYGKNIVERTRRRQDEYRKVEMGIYNFMEGVSNTKIKPAHTELFPLPYDECNDNTN